MFWPWDFGLGWLAGLIGLLFWVGLVVVAILLLKDEVPRMRRWSRPPALDLLEERYARGEISREEFLERRAVLLMEPAPGRTPEASEPEPSPAPGGRRAGASPEPSPPRAGRGVGPASAERSPSPTEELTPPPAVRPSASEPPDDELPEEDEDLDAGLDAGEETRPLPRRRHASP
jgi:putative membrane protein